MKATVLDLRYRMKEVLKALDKREKVTISYHGRIKGTIMPADPDKAIKVEDHPFFNMVEEETRSVVQQMDELRGSRFNDI
jgi:antitoxin (DNA-binding transcriptional repressor) of toxin-antitoxin stability system